jgi:hypothetical protein
MAQITSSTPTVTPTSGEDWENNPMNPQKVLQAYKTTAAINSADLTLYPAIKFVLDYSFKVQDNRNGLTDKNCVYWIYASGDTATRDLDFADANDKIGEAGGGGGGGCSNVISVNEVGNSTIIALGALASFVGTYENVSDFDGITISGDGTSAGIADGTLVMEFSHDAITVHRSISVSVADITSMLPRTLGTITKFFRIRYDNGTTVQSTLSIQTIYHCKQVSLVSRLDQNLQGSEDVQNVRGVFTGQDPDGVFRNVRTTRFGAVDSSIVDADLGFPVIITPGGSMKVGDQTPLVGAPFGGSAISTNKWVIGIVGSGTQDATWPGEIRVNTGTTANSSVKINSINVARFIPAHYNTTHHAVTIPDGAAYAANNVRRWGAFDANDPNCNGTWFELDSGTWYIVHCLNGVTTRTIQGSWNGAGASSFPTNSTTANVYEIEYNAGSIIFRVNGNVIHRETLLTAPYANTIHFPAGFSNVNIGGSTTDVQINLRAAAIFTIGKGFSLPRAFFIAGSTAGTLIKTGPGRLERIIFARNGSAGGNGSISIYDDISAVGASQIGQIEVGGDGTEPITYDVTINNGLFVVITGTGTLSTTITFD